MTIRSTSNQAAEIRTGDSPQHNSGKRILLVEDSPSQAAAFTAFLSSAGFEVIQAHDGEQAIQHLASERVDVVVLDLCLPGIQGVEVLRSIRRHGSNIPAIAITDHDALELAAGAMREGACDFVAKPFSAKQICQSVTQALNERDASLDLKSITSRRGSFHEFIGTSESMQAVYKLVESVAPSKATVFLTGESGTGKELCARAIHAESPRVAAPFVALNCAAIPLELMESEIFGHLRGAFTGANVARRGAALTADGGTLFLDEICEMNLELQAKVLRFVQTGSFNQVGSSDTTNVDVRFICATNRDPLEEVRAGRFREDLYYRLHVVPMQLPALRNRAEDIVSLAQHFLRNFATEEKKSFSRFSDEAERVLRAYPWPGNVRELQNAIRNITVLHDGLVVSSGMLPAAIQDHEPQDDSAAHPEQSAQADQDAATILPLRQVERVAIERAIELCGGNIPEAASRLGVSASTVYRKLRAWPSR